MWLDRVDGVGYEVFSADEAVPRLGAKQERAIRSRLDSDAEDMSALIHHISDQQAANEAAELLRRMGDLDFMLRAPRSLSFEEMSQKRLSSCAPKKRE